MSGFLDLRRRALDAGPVSRPDAPPPANAFPRVPGYAWTWLQRSRPVLHEAALRLTGQPPDAGFVDRLRATVPAEPFVRDVLLAVVCEVAFHGRIPVRRPGGTSWDRGLTWWAAAIAGTTPAEFDARSGPVAGTQRPLFDPPPELQPPATLSPPPGPRPLSPHRAALARALRDLVATAEDDMIPAEAVRQLIAEIEDR
ncbi:hypothetical protein BH23ACT7_BH23ACT7_06270 [soil metagenome]